MHALNSEGKDKIVMVAGTFDLIHPGHLYLIQEARKLGKVVVVVGRDKNVERVKGRITRNFIQTHEYRVCIESWFWITSRLVLIISIQIQSILQSFQ